MIKAKYKLYNKEQSPETRVEIRRCVEDILSANGTNFREAGKSIPEVAYKHFLTNIADMQIDIKHNMVSPKEIKESKKEALRVLIPLIEELETPENIVIEKYNIKNGKADILTFQNTNFPELELISQSGLDNDEYTIAEEETMKKAIFLEHSTDNGMGCWKLKREDDTEFKFFIHTSPLKMEDAKNIEKGDTVFYDVYSSTQLGTDKVILQKIIKQDGTEVLPENKLLTDFDKKLGISKEDKTKGRELILSCRGGYSQHAVISRLQDNNPEHHKVLNGAISFLLDGGEKNNLQYDAYDHLFEYIEPNKHNNIEINDDIFKELVRVGDNLHSEGDMRGGRILNILEQYQERYIKLSEEARATPICSAKDMKNDVSEEGVGSQKP